MRTFILNASAASTLFLLACDPAEATEQRSLDPDQPAIVAAGDAAAGGEGEPELALAAPLVASVELPGDIVVSYYDHFDGTVGVLIKGPARSNLDGALAQVGASVEDAITGTEAALALEEFREGPGPSAAPRAIDPSQENVLADQLRPSRVYCGGINAVGHGTLHANAGNCTEYHRDVGGQTSWEYDDVIAFAGHVSSVDGDFIWDIRKQNWGVGSWYWALQSEPIAGGQQAYYLTSNKDNDFNVTSRVEALDHSSDHHHDVGRCHDWNGRTSLGSTLAGGCSLWLGVVTPEEEFCAGAGEYWGVDPSNIPTSTYWDGNGSSWGC